MYRKFNEYDMRDSFSFPVTVSRYLVEVDGIKGLDPEKSYSGVIKKSKNATYLTVKKAPSPESNLPVSVVDNQTVALQGENWYGMTWDSHILFVFHKYFMSDSKFVTSNNHFSGEESTWRITDFSLVDQFMLSDGVYQAKVSLDNVYQWLGRYLPQEDLSKQKPLVFSDICYHDQKFSISFTADSFEKTDLHSIAKSVQLYVVFNFENNQKRSFALKLIELLRNFLEVLLNRKVGISRILLNRSKLNDDHEIFDERENWFFEQLLLDKSNNKIIARGTECTFKNVEDKFGDMLIKYYNNNKLQKIILSFLEVTRFRVPINLQVVILVSGIEAYYKEATYKTEKHKVIKDAQVKLQHFASLANNPDKIIKKYFNEQRFTNGELLKKLHDTRNYIIHGVKEDKSTSEADLLPYLQAFKLVFSNVLVRILTFEVEENN